MQTLPVSLLSLLIKSLIFFLTIIPEGLSLRAGEMAGLLLYFFWRARRRIAIDAVRKTAETVGLKTGLSPEGIVRLMFRHLGRSFMEIVRLYGGDRRILKRVTIKGIENFHKAKAEGRGIIFLTGHCGNWELMAIVFGMMVEPIGVVARPLNNRTLNGIIEMIRSRYGNQVIYKKGAIRQMLKLLRENKAVGILMDQSVLKQEGLLIDFLGRPAWTSRMPAMIVRKTGAKILPAFIKRHHGGHLIEIGKAIELTGDEIEDTRRLSSYIENYIIENPAEWLWIHRRWKQRN